MDNNAIKRDISSRSGYTLWQTDQNLNGFQGGKDAKWKEGNMAINSRSKNEN